MIAGMNEKCCLETEAKRETAKELLEAMGIILEEMNNEVRMLSDAVYRGNYKPVEKVPNELTALPMVDIMKRQRDEAGDILNELVRIREALW